MEILQFIKDMLYVFFQLLSPLSQTGVILKIRYTES